MQQLTCLSTSDSTCRFGEPTHTQVQGSTSKRVSILVFRKKNKNTNEKPQQRKKSLSQGLEVQAYLHPFIYGMHVTALKEADTS